MQRFAEKKQKCPRKRWKEPGLEVDFLEAGDGHTVARDAQVRRRIKGREERREMLCGVEGKAKHDFTAVSRCG